MPRVKEDKNREHRILMEAVVDCYNETERAMGWYYYLQDKLKFRFKAECFATRAISPLRKGERVQVVGMAPEEECETDMFVKVLWQKRTLAVPLSQLQVLGAKGRTKQGVEDWHYWVKRGYEF